MDGFVFAQFGFGGDEQESVIYVWAGGVPGEEDEICVAVALGVDVHAVADALVEVQFDHAVPPCGINAGKSGFGGGQVGGVLRALDSVISGPLHWPGDYRLCAGEARGGGRFRFHRWIPSCRRSMAAQATWYWAVRSIRSKLSADERQVQRTSNQIERENYEHEHYEKTGRQSSTGHRRFTQHRHGDRQAARDLWHGRRPYVHPIPGLGCCS